MKFIDECNVKVVAGKGGDGAISFRREYRVDKGGPDGGDGGRGGSVYFVGETGMNTLMPLKFKKHIKGEDGEDGKRKDMYGHKGEDIFVKVPLGTLVYDGKRLMHDIVDEQEYLIARGGKGGRGNVKFKTSRNTAPKISEKGDLGDKFELTLVLKVLADVGFVGKPSAGKSTLLSKISNAKPKIADYAFTTLTPQLGIAYVEGDKSFVAADLPGLIKGAHEGKGLGIEFLKHIDRCRIIAHIIDFGDEFKDPIADYQIINEELRSYSLGLEKRKQVVIANKSDLPNFEKNLKKFKAKFKGVEVVPISALTEQNLQVLKHKIYDAFITSSPIEHEVEKSEVTITLEKKVVVHNPFKGFFEIEGTEVERIYNKIPLNSWENFQRFNNMMKEAGVWTELKKKGVQDGNTIRVFGYEFSWGEEEF